MIINNFGFYIYIFLPFIKKLLSVYFCINADSLSNNSQEEEIAKVTAQFPWLLTIHKILIADIDIGLPRVRCQEVNF